MTQGEQVAPCPRGMSRPTNSPDTRNHRWLARLIDDPNWVHLSLQQRERWLSIYLEKL